MRRTPLLVLISLVSVLSAACSKQGSGEAPPPETPAATAESACAQPASAPKEGETPTCGEGCKWNGTECAHESVQRSIIIQDARPKPKPPTQDK